ncbi:hypothetical protein CICLE_v10007064mg, partial [Citrus x clementina]
YLSKFPLCLPRLAPHGQLLASCGSVSLESSYEKATRCIYTSTLLHENRRLGLKPVNVNKSCCQWSLAYCELSTASSLLQRLLYHSDSLTLFFIFF